MSGAGEARESRGRKLAAALIIACGFLLVGTVYSLGLTERNAASRDYIGYWAAAQLLAQGQNPYDEAAVLRTELAGGLGNQELKLTPSPPVGLALVLPLGYFHSKPGLVFWLMAQIGCLALAIVLLWTMYGRPASRVHLLGFLFAPAIACVMAGQLGIFLLLGVTLFLLWHEQRPFLAGVALLPCCLKPHLFLPVALVLLLWVVAKKKGRLLGGFAAAMAASYAVVLAYDPQVWTQYWTMLHTNNLGGRFAPTVSAYLRWDVAPLQGWIEFLPTMLACAGAVWFFWRRREGWNWRREGMPVLLAAIQCAPYAWITDESVLLPAVLAGVYAAIERKRSLVPIALLAGAALVELFANVRITSWYYLWTVPAWIGWYVYATRSQHDDAPRLP